VAHKKTSFYLRKDTCSKPRQNCFGQPLLDRALSALYLLFTPVTSLKTSLRNTERGRLYPGNDFEFMQDSAPSHRTKATQQFLWQNTPDFIVWIGIIILQILRTTGNASIKCRTQHTWWQIVIQTLNNYQLQVIVTQVCTTPATLNIQHIYL